MADELKGKVAIVTGAGNAGGVGEATSRLLAEQGARVVLADLPGGPLEATTKSLRDRGLDVVAHPTDISQELQVKALIAFTKDTYGRLDILDNNAASQGHREDTTIGDMDVALWDKVFAVNARGAMLMCKHALPLMIAGGGGSIINISSGTSIAGDAFASAYAASKGAVNTLTKYVAAQYGAQGVRCNALVLGLITTPALAQGLPPPMLEVFLAHSLTGKLGKPIDVAQMVAFLASERAAFITGQLLPVDGGFYAHTPTTVQVAELIAKMQG